MKPNTQVISGCVGTVRKLDYSQRCQLESIEHARSPEVKQMGRPTSSPFTKHLNRMMGNYHVRFLGGNEAVMPLPDL